MHFSVLEVYLTKNQISTKTFQKGETMSSTLSHLSEFGKLFIKKTSLTETVNVTFLRA